MSPHEDPRPKMNAAIRDAAGKLASLRAIPIGDALVAVASTYEAILCDAVGTGDEWYWRRMLEVTGEAISDVRGEREHIAPVRSLPRGDQ